jgi:serine/threonine protein kinase
VSSHPRNVDPPLSEHHSAGSGPGDWAAPIADTSSSSGLLDSSAASQSDGQIDGSVGDRAAQGHSDHTHTLCSGDESISIELDDIDEESAPLPEILGGYRVGKRLGKGGMGEVYLAEHRSMGRMVAIKVLPSHWLGRAGSVERFNEEIRAASRLMHPNIVTAFDAGQAEGIHYLAMEYVDGKTLSQIVAEEGPMSIGDATSGIRQAAFALHHAHAAGIVHRDVKPGNLMRSREGTIKLLDLGLARFSRQWHNANETPESEIHRSARELKARSDSPSPIEQVDDDSLRPLSSPKRSLMGTLAFISPEQLEDPESADFRSDQYSLGATLFFLLVGHPPFPGETIDQVYGHRHGEIPDLMSFRQDVDLTLANIVTRMLAKSPAQRYGSMDEVARAMAPYDNDRSTPAWVLDFSQRKIDADGSTANDASHTTGQASRKTVSVIGVDLGITHAATAIGLGNGQCSAGRPGFSNGKPQSLFRMAVAEIAAGSGADAPQVLFENAAYELRVNHPHCVSHCQMMYYGRDDMLRRIGGRMCPPVVTTALCLRRLVGNTLMNHQTAASSLSMSAASETGVGANSIKSVLGATWQRHGSWPEGVAITVPSCYDQLHRRAIYTAARIAGLPAVRLIDRGIAIARHAFGSPRSSEVSQTTSHASSTNSWPLSRTDAAKTQTVLYVGLTGQALDVAIIRKRGNKIEQLASAGHWRSGGMVWSSRLVEIIQSRLAGMQEQAKKPVASRSRLSYATKVQIAGERAMNSLLLLPETKVEIRHHDETEAVMVSRSEWLAACEDLLAAIEVAIADACRRAETPVEDLSRCLIHGPILRLPMIRTRIFASLVPDTPVDFFDPSDAAAGAAACLRAELPGQRGEILPVQSRASHSVGFVVADARGKRKIMPIINRGTPTPARTNRQLSGKAKDEHLTLALVESSGLQDESWQTLGRHRMMVDAGEQSPTRTIGLEVDINGLLSVHLERPDLGRTVKLPALPEMPVSADQWEDWREWVEDQA